LEKSYLVCLFRRETGQTPMKMLARIRLDRACDLVANTQMKIGEIGEACGFSTPSFFISEYKKRFVLTPSAHRSNASSTNIDVKKRVT